MRRRQAGLTLIEVMIASAIMVVMMTLTWRTITGTVDSRRTFERFEGHNHDLRMAMGRVVADFEAAYLSRNEDQNATNPRTMFIGKSGARTPEIRFSTLAHRVFWADANESEQTVVSYITKSDTEQSGVTNWIRREQRRPSNDPPADQPADYDVLVHDVVSVKLEYWNWKNLEWTESWDTTQSDGQKGWLPSRVRITVVVKDPTGAEYKVTTQARILMQEALNFTQSN